MQRGIVWAEDNRLDRELILECLAGGPPIEFVDDGVEMLEALGHRRPALAVLDLRMPRLDGLEVLAKLREAPHWDAIPTVVFSALEDPAKIEAVRALGATFIPKPMGYHAFAGAVRRIVDSAYPHRHMAHVPAAEQVDA